MRSTACAALIALATATALPAQTPTEAVTDPTALGPIKTPGDPFETINRAIWGFNQGLDKVLIKPVTQVYRFAAPKPARRGISKIFSNLSEPWSFVNNLLQLKVGRAMNNLGRFVVNTTIGVGGLADHASELGIKPAEEDFGQTLAVWGVKSSAYLVLPLLGPSTVRDGVGTGVAMFADPYRVCLSRCTDLNFIERTGIQATQVLSIRSDLIDSGADAFLASSLDSYATARSAFFQNRDAAIANLEDDEGHMIEVTPGSLDPTAADTPPPSDDSAVPAADVPAATPPAADPATPPPPAGTDAPKLSFNLPAIEG